MPSPEKLIYAKLAAACPTAGVHPVMAVQDAPFPLIVYRRTSTRRDRTLNGMNLPASACPPPVGTYAVAVVAETFTEVVDMADSVRVSLNNFTGEGSGGKIISSALVSEIHTMEPPLEGRDKPLYRVDQVYEIRFQE